MIQGLKIRNSGDKTAEILIYEDIGAGWFSEGVTAKAFLQELRALGKIHAIDVRINSAGGSVFDGLAIYNALKQHPAKVTVHVDGIAASIASVIAMAGQEIRMGEGAFLMIHDPFTMAAGNAADLREVADRLDSVAAQLVDIYAARTGQDSARIVSWMGAETWFDAKDAIANGFADLESEPMRLAAHADVSRFKHPPALQARATVSQPGPAVPSEPAAPAAQPSPKGASMSIMETLRARAAEHQAAAAAIRDKAQAESRDLAQAEREVIASHLSAFDAIQADIELNARLEDATGYLAGSAGRKVPPSGLQNTVLSTPRERSAHGFRSYGEFCLAVRNAVVNPGGVDPRLIKSAASTYGSEGSGPDGGYAVPPEFGRDIQSLAFSEESLLARCDNTPISGNTMTFPKDETTPWGTTGIYAAWEGEGAQTTPKKPAIGESTLKLRKLKVLVAATEELLADAAAMSSHITRKMGEAVMWKANDAIINGTGAGMPLGVLNAASLVAQAKETSQTADTVNATNIAKMYARTLMGAGSNVVWLMNPDVFPQVIVLTINNNPIWVPANQGFQGSPNGLLLGRPILLTDACDTVGDQGDIICANMTGYRAITKAGGMELATSMHLWFDQDIEAFRLIFRMDGQPALAAAVTPPNSSITRSHFVALAART